MILRESTALLFTSHLVLLFVKGWFLYKLTYLFSLIQTPKKEKFMLLLEKKEAALITVAFILLLDELYFLSNFFYRSYPHEYAYIEMLGIIYLIIFIINKKVSE